MIETSCEILITVNIVMASEIRVDSRRAARMDKVVSKLKWFVESDFIRNATPGEPLRSSSFSTRLPGQTLLWQVRAWPRGEGILINRRAGLYLRLMEASERRSWRRAVIEAGDSRISVTFDIIADGEVKFHAAGPVDVPASRFANSHGLGSSDVCSVNELFELIDRRTAVTIVANLVITTKEEVTVGSTDSDNRGYSREALEQELVRDIQVAGRSDRWSDVPIVCGPERLLCHRVTLCSRSPVFKMMLENDSMENSSGTIVIPDEEVTPKLVKDMVDYIYTSRVPTDIEDSCQAMLHLADKYELAGLVKVCQVELVRSLVPESCLPTLVTLSLQDMNSAARRDTLEFAASFMTFLASEPGWPKFIKEYPELVTELVKKQGEGRVVEARNEDSD